MERMWNWTDGGKLSIVVDTSPCTYGLLTSRHALTPENQKKFDQLRILDSIDFVHDELLPSLTVRNQAESVVLHPVCSVTKLDLTSKLLAHRTSLQWHRVRAAKYGMLRVCRRPRLSGAGAYRIRHPARS